MRTGILSGGAAALFGELFAPLYLPATVYSGAAAYDLEGEITRTSTSRSCRAQVDAATETMRAAEGFSATDRAIYILATSLDGALDSDAEVVVHEGPYAGTRWRLHAPIERDPAGAYWLARGVLPRAA